MLRSLATFAPLREASLSQSVQRPPSCGRTRDDRAIKGLERTLGHAPQANVDEDAHKGLRLYEELGLSVSQHLSQQSLGQRRVDPDVLAADHFFEVQAQLVGLDQTLLVGFHQNP